MSGKNGRMPLTTPLSDEVVGRLRAGDRVAITGALIGARDAAHKRFAMSIARGEKLPFEPGGAVVYYVGPSPAPPGRVIGSAGPTTSARMDPYAVKLLMLGVKGMIGKGPRSEDVRRAIEEYGAAYFVATGGAGALLSTHIRRSEMIAFEELGPEAVRVMEVEDFPAVVACDAVGGDLFNAALAGCTGS